jgi:predicted dehydrogenase
MKQLKAGIIGCGGIANGKEMPSAKKTGLVDLVAFCDLIIEKAVQAASDYGTPDAKTYINYKELLKDETLDIVYVCTPNRWHSQITVDALNAGKNVMCEKPMAINSAEAKKMVDAAKKTGKILTIGYQARYRPDSTFLKEECKNGVLGDIYFAKAKAIRRRAVPTWGVFLNEYEQGGGPLIDIGTHALDLTLWLMDNYKPKYAVGTTYHKLNNQKNTANAFGEWDCDKFTVEDSAFGFVVMENGATVTLESSWALNTLDTFEAVSVLCGTNAGADMLDGLRINGVKNGRMYVTRPDLNTGGVAFFEGSAGSSPEVIEQFVFLNAVLGKSELVVKPEQAFVVTQILEAIYESAKSGEPVYFGGAK